MSEQKQSGFSMFVNKHILPPVMKFVNTKAIQALQNGMIYTLPFILIGSIFLILGNIPIPAVANAINASGWGTFFNQAYTTTFSIMAIWQACTLVISTLIYWPFAKKYDKILVKREAAALKKDEAEGK